MWRKIIGWIMFIIGVGGLVFFIVSMVVKGQVIVSSIWGLIVALIWIWQSLKLALSKPKPKKI